MAEHILGRRARFWFGLSDAAQWLRLPWRLQLWCISRAGKAVSDQHAKMDPCEAWRLL